MLSKWFHKQDRSGYTESSIKNTGTFFPSICFVLPCNISFDIAFSYESELVKTLALWMLPGYPIQILWNKYLINDSLNNDRIPPLSVVAVCLCNSKGACAGMCNPSIAPTHCGKCHILMNPSIISLDQ